MPEVDPQRLNAICPYFTMFPLNFPLSVLEKYAEAGQWVFDPYCGRGTTNFASRLMGLPTLGIDSSPVAVANSQAKLVRVAPVTIVRMASRILREVPEAHDVPQGLFWERAYSPGVLHDLCRLREGLLSRCDSDARIALRGLLLGALHGPRRKDGTTSYLSNQCPRTYAPKPAYAIKYWNGHGLVPPEVDLMEIIDERAERYYGARLTTGTGRILLGDSRERHTISRLAMGNRISWVITSPPYYGMKTYIPDQWLRNWFVGGLASVDYSTERQLVHRTPDTFSEQLGRVWRNVGHVCHDGARLVVRFGGIMDRQANPLSILCRSLERSGWSIDAVNTAGSAARGKRQADTFLRNDQGSVEEHDLWATWHPIRSRT